MQTLSHTVEIEVKFSEVDSLHIVWHGHYVRYFEDARESFGKKYKLHYLDVFNKGFIIPIVKINIDYKTPLLYGDTAIIIVTYIPTPAAKIIFRYEIRSKNEKRIVATGETVQVFLDKKNNLILTNPEFFETWKNEHFIEA
jgi:acyl-CoA thioester hydrolase